MKVCTVARYESRRHSAMESAVSLGKAVPPQLSPIIYFELLTVQIRLHRTMLVRATFD